MLPQVSEQNLSLWR